MVTLDKREKSRKKSLEDRALNRVLAWFGGAVILEFFILVLNRFYVNFDADGAQLAYRIFRLLQGLVWVCLVGAVACLAWLVVRKVKGGKVLWPAAGLTAFLVLLVCTLVAVVWRAVGVQFLYITVPAVAVLALVYYLYQREFFLVAVLGGVSLFALWSYRKLILRQELAVYVIFVLAAVATLVLLTGALVLQRSGGKLGRFQVLPAKANYIPLFLGCAVNGASLLAALVGGVTVAYVALFLVVAWLFAAAVYYTVRLL